MLVFRGGREGTFLHGVFFWGQWINRQRKISMSDFFFGTSPTPRSLGPFGFFSMTKHTNTNVVQKIYPENIHFVILIFPCTHGKKVENCVLFQGVACCWFLFVFTTLLLLVGSQKCSLRLLFRGFTQAFPRKKQMGDLPLTA